ncbi:MAG: ArnT family glycosyltransferase, partial [Chloroflexota bacterium]
MTVSRQRQRHIIEFSLLALIVLIGAYLRMGQPGIVEFKRDEANLSLLALEMVHEGHVPLLGITSSVGLPNAPMNVYVLSLPYFISDSPLVATQFIGLLNVIAVALTYGLMRWYVGVWPALMVILLFTTSPWGVMFSRKIWAQNMLPPFVIAVAGCAILGYIERKRWAQVAVWPLLAITGQIHYGAVVIVPAVAMALWLGRRRIAWTPTIVGLLMALVVTLPYLVGLARADLLSLDALHKAVQTDVTTADSAPWYEPLRQAGMIVSGVEIHALTGPERFLDFLATVPDAYPLFWLITVAVGAGTVWLIARAFRVTDRRTSVDLVVVVWLVAPIIIYLFDWTTFYIHYLIPMLPAAFIVLALNWL